MAEKLRPDKIIVYGKPPDEIRSGISIFLANDRYFFMRDVRYVDKIPIWETSCFLPIEKMQKGQSEWI